MTLSPMMQQYHTAKATAADALLLFRMGDFYELFFDDAKTAASALGLTLTSRDKGENPVPMAGFPYHQLEGYLAKLIQQGFRAAVCEQIEDPKQAKGIVKREITRVVTPGTLTDDALLDPRTNNYLAAVCPVDDESDCGLAWLEMSTGRFTAMQIPWDRIADELARIDPVETLWPEQLSPKAKLLATSAAKAAVNAHLHNGSVADKTSNDSTQARRPLVLDDGERKSARTERPAWMFGFKASVDVLCAQFGVHSLAGFGFDSETESAAIRAAGAIVHYLQETQKANMPHLNTLIRYQPGHVLEIDQATRRSLELTRTIRDNKREGTLLAVLDRSVTAMGSRLLSEWIAAPLTNIQHLNLRQDAVQELIREQRFLSELQTQLRGVYDLERLLARITAGRASPRDLAGVARTLSELPSLKAKLTARDSALLNELEQKITLCAELRAQLEAALQEDCPLSLRDGGIIRPGYNAELDRLHDLASGGKQWIAQYQASEIARTGITSLKVGFTRVFGYYLEITNTHAEKIPPEYIRKQTVKNAERYITPELKEYEDQVLNADERSKQLEYELFSDLRNKTAQSAAQLRQTAAVLAQLDVLCSLADLARTRNYCRPTLVAEPEITIVAGRHPVVDAFAPAGTFVPNDLQCGPASGQLLLITGPNMAGKSTYIRQVALIVLLSQIGSFVPAQSATIGIADRIFARVGASDELARGQSTFMVEMTETARILNNATKQSLVILDEIGRGTSTYDGVSLAWAVTEYLHDKIGCRTLFATHYHELTDLADSLSGLRNLNVAVREWDDQVIFLHQIIPGAADKSYGIHVARLAGVPHEVNERAKEILAQLESQHVESHQQLEHSLTSGGKKPGEWQMLLFEPPESPVLDKLREVDLNRLTPIEALQLLQELQREVLPAKKRASKSSR